MLIYFTSVTGHNIEFIHHLYMGAYERDVETIIALPEKFEEQRKVFGWPHSEKIRFELLSEAELGSICAPMWSRAWRYCRTLKRVMCQFGVKTAFVADLLSLLPYVGIMFNRTYRLHGLIFHIYLYRWHTRSMIKNYIEALFFYTLAKSEAVSSIFIGNDRSAAACFNKKLRCSKFIYVPDPFVGRDATTRDLRKEYGISPSDKVLLHFGSMGGRKGTYEILKSIELLTEKQKKEFVFVFAGIVQDKQTFYSLHKLVKDKCRILIFDAFCEFDFLIQWCKACDLILMPYTHTHASSGILAYAASVDKPVLGPYLGLIGKLIRKYSLGTRICKITPETLALSYSSAVEIRVDGEKYISENTVSKFNSVVYSRLMNY